MRINHPKPLNTRSLRLQRRQGSLHLREFNQPVHIRSEALNNFVHFRHKRLTRHVHEAGLVGFHPVVLPAHGTRVFKDRWLPLILQLEVLSIGHKKAVRINHPKPLNNRSLTLQCRHGGPHLQEFNQPVHIRSEALNYFVPLQT